MRRQHRAYPRAVEPLEQAVLPGAPHHLLQRVVDASGPARVARVRVAAAVLLHILGDVEQMGEIAERPDHVQRLFDRQRVELCVEPRLLRFALAEAHRRLADRLDSLPCCGSDPLLDYVAEQPPQQPSVLAERLLLVNARLHRR
jgi:hypothetical protein